MGGIVASFSRPVYIRTVQIATTSPWTTTVNSDLKRRMLIFGTGVMLGGVMSIYLLRYAAENQESAPLETIHVAISTCDLKAGDLFEERCAEKREVETRLTPPDVLLMKRTPLYVGKELATGVPVGNAFRVVDFR